MSELTTNPGQEQDTTPLQWCSTRPRGNGASPGHAFSYTVVGCRRLGAAALVEAGAECHTIMIKSAVWSVELR
jgi:hypothetical protein